MSFCIEKEKQPKTILVVGGGAAGVAAAFSLSLAKDRHITLVDPGRTLGGVATTSATKDGIRFNDGVQGAHPSYANTLAFHKLLGYHHNTVSLSVSFGTGGDRWTNTKPWPILEKHAGEIRRFRFTLKMVNALRALFAGISIAAVLKFFGFSEEFRSRIVFPLTALFFGTGNTTSKTSSVLVSRVFFDDKYRLFEYDSERFVSSSPKMVCFDHLSDVYNSAEGLLRARGVRVFKQTTVRSASPSDENVCITFHDNSVEIFDAVIFACGAEATLRILGERATEHEKAVLGSVSYYDDVTVTHTDSKYMREKFETDEAMYTIRNSDAERHDVFEMGFNLSAYQKLEGVQLYQTIFLNQKEKCTWSIDDIDPSKVVLTKTWRQFSHEASHYLHVVPKMKHLHRKNVIHCGAWVLANTHEIACVSGFCAAKRIGCDFPFRENKEATETCESLYDLLY